MVRRPGGHHLLRSGLLAISVTFYPMWNRVTLERTANRKLRRVEREERARFARTLHPGPACIYAETWTTSLWVTVTMTTIDPITVRQPRRGATRPIFACSDGKLTVRGNTWNTGIDGEYLVAPTCKVVYHPRFLPDVSAGHCCNVNPSDTRHGPGGALKARYVQCRGF